MKIDIIPLKNSTYIFEFDTQYNMGMSFVRIHAFLQAKPFLGRCFTLGEFVDTWFKYYSKDRFEYPYMQDHFCFPTEFLWRWNAKFMYRYKSIMPRETMLINSVARSMPHLKDIRSSYLIAIHKEMSSEDRETLVNQGLTKAFNYYYPENVC